MGADFGKAFMNLIDPGRTFSTAAKLISGKSIEASFGSAFDEKQAPAAAAPNVNQSLGNLTAEETSAAAAKRVFREGLYFTSPTGVYGTGSRGRSRLMGK